MREPDGKKLIFVVEDHAATACAVKALLETCGFTIALADSFKSALELAKTTEFDVLLCDLNLPDGNGWDLMKQLSQKRQVRGIAFSAYDEPEHIARSRAAGFSDHIVKGSAPETLLAAIQRLLPAD